MLSFELHRFDASPLADRLRRRIVAGIFELAY